MRFEFDPRKSRALKRNPRRGISLKEAESLWEHPHAIDQCSEFPEQFRAIGWVGHRLITVIFEIRDDGDGEYYWSVTLWRATREERLLYEENI